MERAYSAGGFLRPIGGLRADQTFFWLAAQEMTFEHEKTSSSEPE
jgi:hypothetical protein